MNQTTSESDYVFRCVLVFSTHMLIQLTQTTIRIGIKSQNSFIHASNDMKRTKKILSVEKNWFVIFDFYLSGS